MGLNLWSKRINMTKAPTTSTHMTSEKTSQTKEASQLARTTKQPTAVDGGKKTRNTHNRQVGRINKNNFELIHLLHERGLKKVEIANIVKLSPQRVGFIINHCPTWEAYEERKKEAMLAWREKQATKVEEEHHEEHELEQWQFIVGWSNESQRVQANAVRDLARALGLRVEE